MLFIVSFMDGEEKSSFVDGFINEEGSSDPINGQVGGSEPRESKNDIVFKGHNVEGNCLGDFLNVGEKSTSMLNVSLLVNRSISISGVNGDSKFCNNKVVFFDKVIVGAGDVSTTINESIGINGF